MKAMAPSDAIDLNRPMTTSRLMPAALVQEKAGLPKAACIPGNIMTRRAHVNSRMNDLSRYPLFPIEAEERVATNRHNEHLLFLLGETLELKVPRLGLLSSLKRMIIRPSIPPSIPPPSSATLYYTPQFTSSIPVPLEESPLFKAPAPMAIITPPREETPQPNAPEFSGNIMHQGLHLQLRMAMETTCTANRAAVGSVGPTEASPQPFSAHHTPLNRTLNSTSLGTLGLKNPFVEAVSEVTTEADSSSFPLTPLLSPLERAIAEARAAGYHLHKPISLISPPPTPTAPRGCSVETQHVLHGDGLRRLVLFKNASAYYINDKNTEKSSSSSSSLNIDVQNIDFALCLKRVGRGVGDDWVNRVRVMPSTVNLDVRLWDSKRTDDDKIEVQLGKALLKSSPLKRVLKNTTPKQPVDLEESRSIRRCLRSVRSNLHRQRVVADVGAKRASQSTPSLVSIPPERRRERVRNRVRAKRRDVSRGTSEALAKVRRWSDGWKRRARLMAMPKPDISATRSNHAREASALSAILTTADVDRRPGWFNPKEHVKKDHIYFEEDTSDEESTEHDDETDIDDVCHTSCEPVFVSLPSPVDTSPSSKLSNSARLLVQVKEEIQDKGPENGKHGRIPLFGVYSLKAFERQSKRT